MLLAIFFLREAGRRCRREVFLAGFNGAGLSAIALSDESMSAIIFLWLICLSMLFALLEFLGLVCLVAGFLIGLVAELARLFCEFF